MQVVFTVSSFVTLQVAIFFKCWFPNNLNDLNIYFHWFPFWFLSFMQIDINKYDLKNKHFWEFFLFLKVLWEIHNSLFFRRCLKFKLWTSNTKSCGNFNYFTFVLYLYFKDFWLNKEFNFFITKKLSRFNKLKFSHPFLVATWF